MPSDHAIQSSRLPALVDCELVDYSLFRSYGIAHDQMCVRLRLLLMGGGITIEQTNLHVVKERWDRVHRISDNYYRTAYFVIP